MPASSDTVYAAIAFLLPGALYEWSYERVVGSWNVQTGDRVIRFLGSSAVLHALALPATVAIWRRYLDEGLTSVEGIPWGLWAALLAAIAVPTLLGGAVGQATKSGRRWVVPLTRHRAGAPCMGPPVLPRRSRLVARQAAQRRLRRRSVRQGGRPGVPAGLRRGVSHPTDLYLINQVHVDPESGEFLTDEAGNLVAIGSGILIREDQIEVLEFFEAHGRGSV